MRIVSIAIVDKDIYLGTVYCEDKYIDKVLLMFPGFTKLGTDYNPNKKDYGVTYLHLKQFDFPAVYGYAHKHEHESLNKLVFEHAEDITVRVCGLGMIACFEQIKQEQFLSLPDPQKQEQEDEANMELEQKYQRLALILNHHNLKLAITNSRLIGRVRFEHSSDSSPIQGPVQLKILVDKVNAEMPTIPDGIWSSYKGVITHRPRKPNYRYTIFTGDDLLDIILETLDKDLSAVIESSKGPDVYIPTELPVSEQSKESSNGSPSLKAFLELSEAMGNVGLTLTPEQENKLLHDAVNELQEEICSLQNQLDNNNQYGLDA